MKGGLLAQSNGSTTRVLPIPRPPDSVTRVIWTRVRPVAGAGILAFLLWRLGTGPFVAGLRALNGWALASALSIGALTTVCCAWRWSLVARGLGVALPLRSAVAHCYRSVFLNATLPGGILGDVHRAVQHGRDAGDVGRGIRAVVWERTAGQVVQAAIALVVLASFPSPVRAYMPEVLAVAAAVGLATLALARILPPRGAAAATPRRGLSRWMRALHASREDIRDALLAHRNWPGILLASTVVVCGHLATFVIAAHTAGATASIFRLLPLTLLALLAMGLPLNVGGWGPREGVAAWAFGAAGLTATQGLTTAVVYGALVLVSSLPGACVLLVPRVNRVRQSWSATAEPAGDLSTSGRAPMIDGPSRAAEDPRVPDSVLAEAGAASARFGTA